MDLVCSDKNECEEADNNDLGNECVNTIESYTCKCRPRCLGNDIDECLLGHHDCKGVDVCCKNTMGVYVCDCGPYLDYRNGKFETGSLPSTAKKRRQKVYNPPPRVGKVSR
ncbi:unnamed protein product [Clavelina lepadiformis]|uniref:NOTCH1 EGF-like calcium-binding domain-containing protein n=1 Tax=Clavelina lepadiformis TaxID=159417 RepID=A0ABP0EW39_CLALP